MSAPFVITPSDRIATAGSCFAQNIAFALQAKGLTYHVEESAPRDLTQEEASRRNFGVYSCRYGNLYTARQLLQLLLRAYGRLSPRIDFWKRPDGRLIDPFRPQIEPDGFATLDALHADREAHLAAVRRLFETLNVFVFTLGQTECWQARADGAVVPLAPGVVGGDFDDGEFTFHNLKASETAADFLAFTRHLREVNPRAKIILTLSPVPLVATFQSKHALVANAGNKAALRVAVDEIIAARPDMVYFPSYEIVTASCNAARFYDDSQRTVTPLGVAQVMRVFFRHFTQNAATAAPSRIDARDEAAQVARMVCEEEALHPE